MTATALTIHDLRRLNPADAAGWLESLTDTEVLALRYDWLFWAREAQLPPDGDWLTWMILAGRGFGKTRTGAEWVRQRVERGARRIAIIAETQRDLEQVLLEGESGLLEVCPPGFIRKWTTRPVEIEFASGAVALGYNGTEPGQLRGPQFDTAWADELAKWRYAEEAWEMLQYALRLDLPDGSGPRQIVTTTPKPRAIIRNLLKEEGVRVVRGSTYDNMSNLARTFIDKIIRPREGTRLGRQEIDGELIEDIPGALWTWALLEASRVSEGPGHYDRIVVAVDPPATAGGDEAGIVAAGLIGSRDSGTGYVIADHSEGGLSPNGWGSKAVKLYHELKADRIVIETNQGGDMAEQTIRNVDANVPITRVHASRGKKTRAEPISALYEQGRVRHIGAFPTLEEQMTSYTGDPRDPSPDRLDAAVYALTELMVGDQLMWVL